MGDVYCAVDGCDRPRKHRLYCTMHHRRWKKYGDVRADIPGRTVCRPGPGATCLVEGCETKPKSRGWCGKHYQRWKYQGDPLDPGSVIRGDDEARFWTKVDKAGPVPEERPDLGPCWIWTSFVDPGGYGMFKADGWMQRAHRWAMVHFVAPVPRELEVDHLCFVRHCVNFESHLEVVTPLVNTRRSHGGARKTHCKNGHPFDEANTYLRPEGGRRCRACGKAATERYLHSRRDG